LFRLSPIFDKNTAHFAESCANIRRIEVFMARLNEGRWSPRPEAPVRSGFTVLPWDPADSLSQKRRIPKSLWVYTLLALACFACLSRPTSAQTDVNDIHVQPREVEKPKEPPKENVVSTTKDGLTTRVRPLKVDVDLVLVPVTITDPMRSGRFPVKMLRFRLASSLTRAAACRARWTAPKTLWSNSSRQRILRTSSS
jgi:hypothetical protein